jgi:predicted metal-dependent phosphoesterase TrpH
VLTLGQIGCKTMGDEGPRFARSPRLLIDLHTHTYPKSGDSFLTLEGLVARAKEVGLDGLCLTEHDQFWEPDLLERWARKLDFPIFSGCEVTTEEGHLLLFGLDSYIFGMHQAAFVRERVMDAGGVAVVAHPYRGNYRAQDATQEAYESAIARVSRNVVYSFVDAVEVLNGRGSADENAFSLDVSRHFGMPGTGASDAHRLEDVGTFATEFGVRINKLGDLIKELKAGRFRPVALYPVVFPSATESSTQV